MIDHTGIIASNFEHSKKFYQEALAAIGYELVVEFPASVTGDADVAGFGEGGKPDFWVALAARRTSRRFTSLSASTAVLSSMLSTRPLWQLAVATMASRDCAHITIPITTEPTCSIPTATISKLFVTKHRPGFTAAAAETARPALTMAAEPAKAPPAPAECR